jgi:hypothetical protein
MYEKWAKKLPFFNQFSCTSQVLEIEENIKNPLKI